MRRYIIFKIEPWDNFRIIVTYSKEDKVYTVTSQKINPEERTKYNWKDQDTETCLVYENAIILACQRIASLAKAMLKNRDS